MSFILRSFILGPKSHRLLSKRKQNIRKDLYRCVTRKSGLSVERGPFFIAAQAAADYCCVALITDKGKIVKLSLQPLKIFQSGIFYELSTDQIWQCLTCCIKKVTANVNVADIKGIGFISTLALVCLDKDGNPVTASVTRDPSINCILSYDQRSILEAEKIGKTRHARLKYYGDTVSFEVQESKLMWLKNNLYQDCWKKAEHFMNLNDFLTWKATGSLVRCSSVLLTNWSYEATISGHEGWDENFLKEIGLPEMAENNFSKIGSKVQRPCTAIAQGLLPDAAAAMGLPVGLPVSVSLSDSLAGGLGVFGCRVSELDNDVTKRLCIIYTTKISSHFVQSREPLFIKGICGPIKDCIQPDLWLNRAGQTTADCVLEYFVTHHPAVKIIKRHIGNMHIHKYLNKILKFRAQKYQLEARSFLTKDVHVLPDFEGNQSPLGDAHIRGTITGTTLTGSQESLAITYLAAMQSLAYSTRHILSHITQHGHTINSIVLGGDLSKNSLFIFLHKDICQRPTISPDESRCRLIGAAILASMAANYFKNINEAMDAMNGKGTVLWPDTNPKLLDFHNRKYTVFLKLYQHQMEYRRIMGTETKSLRQMGV